MIMETQGWILELMMVDVYLVLNIPAIFTLTIQDKLLVVMEELGVGPIPANIPPITHNPRDHVRLFSIHEF